METLTVDLGERSYPIYIGQDLLGQTQYVVPHVKAKQVMIVTNETIAPLYLEKTLAAFSEFNTASVILPDGEEYKNLEVLNQIFDSLLKKHCDRQVTLVALGGGVVGDMTGFAAASYQRGVPFIQIPTTLLAQVDSSVGGKTGVNHALGKNMIGAFHQPQCVVIDTNTLNTLEDRQLKAGAAEVIKYGLINDPEFFSWLETNIQALLSRDPQALSYAIACSCQDKADIVSLDEKEAGMRALLNLGHTFGHAIETAMNYTGCLHGEGVSIGMCLAAKLSQKMGWITSKTADQIIRLIEVTGLPSQIPPNLNAEQLLTLMQIDKKVQAGRIRFVLLKAIGKTVVTDDYDPIALKNVLEGA